jgi:preprotein translocase subunit YajC
VEFRKFLIGVTTAALMGGAAIAADTAVKTGATIYDTAGGTVGIVDSVTGDLAVVSTGTNKVSLPISSFGVGDKGPVIAMTKAQLDAAASGAKADQQKQTQAALTPGATVYGSNGGVLGTVDSVDSQFVTLAIGEQKAKVPLNAVGKGEKGPMVAMNAEDVKAAVKTSTEQSAQTAPSTGSSQN